MRVVIADTSPINYLILIDAIEVLRRLYRRVSIPAEVFAELSAPGAPPAVARWIAAPPGWLEVMPPADAQEPLLQHLDAGEAAAIRLALTHSDVLLLVDDARGKAEAARRGIETAGTLAILSDAAARNLIELPPAVAKLLRTNFRIAQSIVAEYLAEDRRRREGY